MYFNQFSSSTAANSLNRVFHQKVLTPALTTLTTLALCGVAMAEPVQPFNLVAPDAVKGSQSFQVKDGYRDEVLRIETAENATLFVFDDAPLLDNGFPAYGNTFITQGYIYPAGTLNGGNGVNPDGSPEFPELVLGHWFCRGWFVNEDGAAASTGALVIATQIFNFGDEVGNQTIVTDGLELVDVGVPVTRAIIGGTGRYRAAVGEVHQVLLGPNATEGLNLQHEITISHPDD